jgi:hypothetical protein
MAERTGPGAMIKRFRQELPELRYMIDQLPGVARRLIDLANREPPPPPDREQLQRQARRIYIAFTGAITVVAGVVLVGLQAQPVWLGWWLAAAGAALLYAGRPRD